MHITDWIVLIVIVAIVGAAIRLHKLTVAGALIGGLLAVLLYLGAGLTGITMLAAFFIGGTVATSIGKGRKEKLGIAEENSGQRTAGQVLANGGVAGLAGLAAWCWPEYDLLGKLMAAAALSSAAADTLSSELGSIYGKRFYNVLTFRKDIRGLNGVVSLEGTLCGVGGSVLISIIYSVGYGYSGHALWIILAGTIGNLTDSVLGATLERKQVLSNDLVNGLNTLVAALTILLFY